MCIARDTLSWRGRCINNRAAFVSDGCYYVQFNSNIMIIYFEKRVFSTLEIVFPVADSSRRIVKSISNGRRGRNKVDLCGAKTCAVATCIIAFSARTSSGVSLTARSCGRRAAAIDRRRRIARNAHLHAGCPCTYLSYISSMHLMSKYKVYDIIRLW